MTTSRRILLARHGQTAWNALGKLQGHTDVPLDATGNQQAQSLARALQKERLTAVWTSDLCRARETGAIVAQMLGLGPPSVDAGLRERGFGIFEGLTRDECAAQHPESWRLSHTAGVAPAGGEPGELAIARMHQSLIRIAAALEDDAARALVISHGGIMRLWLREHVGGDVPPIPNGAVYVVELHRDRVIARRSEP